MYDGNRKDILSLQSQVTQEIARKLRVRVTPQESQGLKATRQVDQEVYLTALKGKLILEHAYTQEGFNQAIELFQRAVDKDPTYAPAWAGLGQAFWSLASAAFEFVAPDEVRDKAIAAVEKALELDENPPDAHQARALIAIDGEWDLDKARRHFERALELRPRYAAAHNKPVTIQIQDRKSVV